jgi:uncharacterized membrane protein
MNGIKIAMSAFATGIAVTYLADPDRGNRRRALARDQGVKTWRDFSALLDKARRDLANRASGAFHGAKAIFRDHGTDDDVLVQRVRSRLGRLVSHPHAIEINVEAGQVVLTGPVLENELDRLLNALKSVPGVKSVANRLDVCQRSDHISSLQGGVPRRSRTELMQKHWTPALRVAAGGLGSALLIQAVRKDGALKLVTGLAGITLLTRAVTDMELREIAGIGDGARVIEIDKAIHIHAPVEEVFAFWSDYQKFPCFMTHFKEVRDLGEGKSHWVAEGPGGLSISWDAEISECIPNKLLAWRSVPGSRVETEGSVRFDQDPNGGTRATIRMFYKPPAGVLGHYVASLFGANPKQEMDDDMVRLKSLIELGRTRAHGKKVIREDLKLDVA